MSQIRVPDLGENIDEAAVLRVLVHEGDHVEHDQPILELESDKATFELPSPEAGVVRKILVHEGDTVKVGQSAIELDAGEPEAKASESPAKPEETEAKEAKAEQPPAKAAPETAEPIKNEAARVTAEKPERETAEHPPAKAAPAKGAKAETTKAETSKANAKAEAFKSKKEDAAKVELESAAPAPEIVEPRLREVQATPPAPPAKPPQPPETEEAESVAREPRARETATAGATQAASTPPTGEPTFAVGPATRRLARELGVDLADVARRANTQHVTREHVLAYLREQAGPKRGDERVQLERVRRIGADRLAAAWREVPLVTHHELADITEIESARRTLRDEEPELALTITAIAAKACAIALRSHPRLNSSLDLEHGEIIIHHACHLGIAVDTEQGLLVPVVHDVGRKSTRELAAEIAELAERARARKLSLGELTGATFTITNLGGISGTSFTPIVVPPQVAILGLSRARPAQHLQEGAPSERTWLPLSLSYDHRAVDGAEAARFVAALAHLLRSPVRMLLDC